MPIDEARLQPDLPLGGDAIRGQYTWSLGHDLDDIVIQLMANGETFVNGSIVGATARPSDTHTPDPTETPA